MLKIDELLSNIKPDSSTLKSLSPWSPVAMLARTRRFVHGLTYLGKLLKSPNRADVHCNWDAYDDRGNLLVIGCTCGKVFWYRSQKGRKSDETDGQGDSEEDQDGGYPY